MAARSRPLERLVLRAIAPLDALCNRLYESRYNPLYQSGTIVTALLLLLLVTGLWLIFFYRVGAPYDSVARITADPWLGNWVRGVHRYASDVAVIAIAVHALRMFAQGRSWGPRTLAWTSGVFLLLLTLISGWTGYVMVWDSFGELLAREGARMLDALPILSEPISRAFTGERPVPPAFFFLNLFAHVAIPLSMLLVLWLHTSRLARPTLLPPRALMWGTFGLLVLLSLVRPMRMAMEADPLRIPAAVPTDIFFAFWLPMSRALPGGVALAGAALTIAIALAIPMAARRRGAAKPAPSRVDEDLCTGCRQCFVDCPYEAITMLPRNDGRADEVARVDPDRCVSCGICAGSCAPMGVGPAGRTGRDQLSRAREFLARPERSPGELVTICCDRLAWLLAPVLAAEDVAIHPVDCAGSVHTSVIELLVRSGSAGVLVLSCPARDCWNREGPRWLDQRVYHDREAELQARVDRRRVRLVSLSAAEHGAAREAVLRFRSDLATAGMIVPEESIAIDAVCEPVPVEEDS